MAQAEFTDFEIELDLSAQDAWGGEQRPLAPPGDYNLTIVGFEQKTGKTSGAAYIAVTFEIANGEHAGSKVWNNYSLSAAAVGRMKSLMLACKTELTRIVASQFVGQTIRASLVHEIQAASVDANGNPLPERTNGKVINEQPLEEAEAPKAAATTKTPPALNGKPATGAKAATQPRRA